jgi:signal recognition particle subunit SEC65
MIKQCLIFFGGVVNEGSGQFSFQAGTAPSRCTIRTRLGVRYPHIGTLRITDGRQYRDFPDCRVVRHTIKREGGGWMREIVIEDRRWRWSRTRIWGVYNTTEKGVRDPDSEKSARELAVLCLEAMKETGFDASVLPEDSYPDVSWDAASASAALESICAMFGCVVVLHPASNRVRIHKNNVGRKPAVDSRAMDQTPSSEPQVVPPLLIFEGGHTLWQRDLVLEPVGIDKLSEKEVVRKLDELSYKPDPKGWGNPRDLINVDVDSRDLARRCVYRMFRVKPPFNLTPPPSGLKTTGKDASKVATEVAKFFEVAEDALWRILPINSKQVSAAGLDEDGALRDAALLGAFVRGKVGRKNNVDKADYNFDDPELVLPDDEELLWTDGFSIDAQRGIVTTNVPCYYLNNSVAEAPALRLRVGFGLRHPETRQFVSQQYRFKPPSPTPGATLPDLTKQSDVFFEILEKSFESGSYPSVTNASQFIAAAQLYLAERLNSLYPDEAISIPYKGFVFDWEVDGAIRSVTWATSRAGGTTLIDYSIERPEMRITHTQLREQSLQVAHQRDAAAATKRLRQLLGSQRRSIL